MPTPVPNLDALMEKLEDVEAESAAIRAKHGEDQAAWPAGQVERHARLATQAERLRADIEAAYERAEKVAAVREAARNPRNVEHGFGGGPTVVSRRHSDPWAGLGVDATRADSLNGLMARAHDAIERMDESVPDSGREVLADMLRTDASTTAASYVLAASDPTYTSAFTKAIGSEHGFRRWTAEEVEAFDRVENVRATMSLTSGNGGYLVPVPLDPTIILNNSGIVHPLRELARVETTAHASWTGAASAGATATWTSENTALTEGSPTFTAVSVTPNKLTAWLTASYEIFQDSNIVEQIPNLVADAFDRAEGAAFATGSGTPPTPQGIVTAIAAAAGSTVTATTRGSFTTASVGDVFNMANAVPARPRNGRIAWIANRAIFNIIRQMSPSAAGSSFWATLGDATPRLLLDYPVYEVSSMTSATTSGSSLMILGDFTQFLVVDRIGTVIEPVANVVDGSGVPTGTRGWVAWKRTGATVTNTDAFRRLLS